MDDITGVDHPVIEGHEEGGHLEDRAWLTTVTDGIVDHLIVFAVFCTAHVDDGFHIACLHFHQDGHTHLTANLLQFVDDRPFCQVLHAHVDGGHNVAAVDR